MNDCSYRDKLLIYVEVLNREEEEVGLIFSTPHNGFTHIRDIQQQQLNRVNY